MSKLSLLVGIALVSLAFVAPAASASGSLDKCVEYAYVADYNWYYLCASTSGDCAVYQKHVSGVSETRTCYVDAAVVAWTPGYCSPYVGDMDHMFALCVGNGHPVTCYVYESFQSGGEKCLA